MSPLALLWWVSCGLAAVALIWMAALVAARLRRARVDADRAHDRHLVRVACLEIVAGAGDAAMLIKPMRRRARLLAESLLEFTSIVRGEERDRLVSAFRALAVDDRLRRRLFRGSRTGRTAAAEALAVFPGADTVAALRRLLEVEDNAEVRVAAVRTLAELGSPPPLADLIVDLKRRGLADSLFYVPVVNRLTALEPEQAIAAFASADTGPAARAMLADALAGSGEYRAIDPLRAALADPDPHLRTSAARALGVFAHPLAADDLTRALADAEWEVRAAACQALSRLASPAHVPALAGRLNDDVWWVRFQASEALAGLGQAGVDRLRLAARSDIDAESRAASLALAERDLAEAAA
jgi:HEAT repeat protein